MFVFFNIQVHLLQQGGPSHLCHSFHMHQAGCSHQGPLVLLPPPCSPGLSSVIGMKGNGPERRGKETFLHTYLLTPTVSAANSNTESGASLCMHKLWVCGGLMVEITLV